MVLLLLHYVRSDVQSWKRVWMRINVVGSIEGQMQVFTWLDYVTLCM